MAFYDKFPYTNFQELNLDWILQYLKEQEERIKDFIAVSTIKYADPIQWNITTQYEANTIVIDPETGTAYISTQPVPAGVALDNTDYWTVIFELNTIFEPFQEQLDDLSERTGTAEQNITDLGNNVTGLTADVQELQADMLRQVINVNSSIELHRVLRLATYYNTSDTSLVQASIFKTAQSCTPVSNLRVIMGMINNVNDNAELVEVDIGSMTEIRRSGALTLGHCNGICYNPNTNKIIVAPAFHTTNGVWGDRWYSLFEIDYNTLTIDREITLDYSFNGVAWDAATGKMYGTSAGNRAVYEIDPDTYECTYVMTMTGLPDSYTFQSIAAYKGNIFAFVTEPNNIIVYDLAGTLVRKINLRDFYSCYYVGELEGGAITADGTLFVPSNARSGYAAYMYAHLWEVNLETGTYSVKAEDSRQEPFNGSMQVNVYPYLDPDGTEEKPFPTLQEAALALQSDKYNRMTINIDCPDETLYLFTARNKYIDANNHTIARLVISAQTLTVYKLKVVQPSWYTDSAALVRAQFGSTLNITDFNITYGTLPRVRADFSYINIGGIVVNNGTGIIFSGVGITMQHDLVLGISRTVTSRMLVPGMITGGGASLRFTLPFKLNPNLMNTISLSDDSMICVRTPSGYLSGMTGDGVRWDDAMFTNKLVAPIPYFGATIQATIPAQSVNNVPVIVELWNFTYTCS